MKQFAVGLIVGLVLVGLVASTLDLPVRLLKEEAVPTVTGKVGQPRQDDVWMIARMVAAEARGEPFQGQVAVAAVIINRVRDARFPGTVNGVIYQPLAFEPILNGSFWRVNVTNDHVRAARLALNGWDPSYGSTFFWNPATAVSRWIWSRRIITRIGKHVFGV
ncbi:MAG: cell wall hydrolase [Bacillota bacterium]